MSHKLTSIFRIAVRVLAFYLLFLILPEQSIAQENECLSARRVSSVAADSVDLFVNTNSSKFNMNQLITIDAGLRNDSARSIYVYKYFAWGAGGGFTISVRNKAGEIITSPLRDDTLLPPSSSSDDLADFVKLEPGNFIGMRRNLAIRDLINKPGVYIIQIEYNNPFSCKIFDSQVQRMRVLWRNDPAVFSNKITITVTTAP